MQITIFRNKFHFSCLVITLALCIKACYKGPIPGGIWPENNDGQQTTKASETTVTRTARGVGAGQI